MLKGKIFKSIKVPMREISLTNGEKLRVLLILQEVYYLGPHTLFEIDVVKGGGLLPI